MKFQLNLFVTVIRYFYEQYFLDLLKERVIVFDGAMGSNLQSQNLTIDDWGSPNFENCSENLLYTKLEAIEKVHIGFLEIVCNTELRKYNERDLAADFRGWHGLNQLKSAFIRIHLWLIYFFFFKQLGIIAEKHPKTNEKT